MSEFHETEISQREWFIRDMVRKSPDTDLECFGCGDDLTGAPVQAYRNASGWSLPWCSIKYWLSIKCPSCKYETSFDKLGVPRD